MRKEWFGGLALLACALTACEKAPDNTWQGYIEGEFVLLASPYAGQLQKLYVRRGDQIDGGKPVFALEQEAERAARLEAEERLKSAQARLENLKVPRRPPEIEAIRGQLEQAKAARELSVSQLRQRQRLFKEGFIAQAQLRNARMPLGRDSERDAAVGEMKAAQAALAQAAWRLEQKSVGSPVAGLVQDTFFVEGEWVPAGRPVASLLPPGNVKARFYVPESVVGAISAGKSVEIRCDGCAAPISAKLTYISGQAEYTPPVLYSKESRNKLMFLVEARPDPADGAKLRPGQPVDVRLK